MSYKVVIPTAGIGSRLDSLTKYLNKSLVSLACRPVLSHTIDQFPKDCVFVIVLGHKGHLVRDFLKIAYPKRTFQFATVDPYIGPNSGLGRSLLCSEKFLQEPFVFVSCDTLVKESIPAPKENWMGFHKVKNVQFYRTLEIKNQRVKNIFEKGANTKNQEAYIGLAGIKDCNIFWDAMHKGDEAQILQGEVFGLRDVIEKESVSAHYFTWHDTGNQDSLKIAQKAYDQGNEPIILHKEKEAIWFVGKTVIKFSDDEVFIKNRVKRALLLNNYVPKVKNFSNNMYSYSKVNGRILSEAITLPIMNKLLEHCNDFWKLRSLNEDQRITFNQICLKFYKDKTIDRLNSFYKKYDQTDSDNIINGEHVPSLHDLFIEMDWTNIANGIPCRFHGDFHFENILWEEHKERFSFLDWRQDFGGNLEIGDIYYDLAKLLHGLIVNHHIIHNNYYSVEWNNSIIKYTLLRKQILIECEDNLDKWCTTNKYDTKKVRMLTALIYLNIAVLHEYPYSILLYALGKRMLYSELNK